MNTHQICTNLAYINARIETICKQCGRDPKDIHLVAVSKTKPVSDILSAVQCGQLAFGENKMQELQDKMFQITNPDISWHMIGTLQTNKIRLIADKVDWIHSVPKAKHLDEIEKRAAQNNRMINVLIQVNISNEDQKSGCSVSELAQILDHAKGMEHILIKGLMGIASFVENPEDVRSEFRLLKNTLQAHKKWNGGNIDLCHLSMGMTNDMDVAIQEGATMIRIGSAIFGSRNIN